MDRGKAAASIGHGRTRRHQDDEDLAQDRGRAQDVAKPGGDVVEHALAGFAGRSQGRWAGSAAADAR